jgi:hypothetical protein
MAIFEGFGVALSDPEPWVPGENFGTKFEMAITDHPVGPAPRCIVVMPNLTIPPDQAKLVRKGVKVIVVGDLDAFVWRENRRAKAGLRVTATAISIL